jgi:BlaI family penicillinase repressor
MDVIYRLGRATAADVQAALPDAPSYSTIRALLKVLETKGHVRHTTEGPRYVYAATVSRERARESALRQLVGTFFDGSTEATVAALLGLSADQLSDAELNRLADLIVQAKKEGR